MAQLQDGRMPRATARYYTGEGHVCVPCHRSGFARKGAVSTITLRRLPRTGSRRLGCWRAHAEFAHCESQAKPENRDKGECEHGAHAEPVITPVVLGAPRTRFNVTGVVLRELSVPTAIRS